MSILIKGIDMPKSCYDCEIRIKCGCKVANASGWLNNKLDDHCPFAFVEVPKHGRLIDADALDLEREVELADAEKARSGKSGGAGKTSQRKSGY